MTRYWVSINGQTYGGNNGYTETEMLGFIVQHLVFPDTLVSVNGAAWIAAKHVPALQQAFSANQVQQQPIQNVPPQPSVPTHHYCYDELEGRENWPYALRAYLADRGFGITTRRKCY